MIAFDKFWNLHNPMPEYAHMRKYCEKIWNNLPPDKQEIIYRTIEEKRKNNRFVDYNPFYAIQKNANPPRRTYQLSFNEYYARYGTTEEIDGWHMANPTGHQVIYVKWQIEHFNNSDSSETQVRLKWDSNETLLTRFEPPWVRHIEHFYMTNNQYPLYDVPYLVRDPNVYRMSAERHAIETRNQAIVDDYFIARNEGLTAREARRQVAEKHRITTQRVYVIIHWFFNQARKRKKFDFLEKFLPLEEH